MIKDMISIIVLYLRNLNIVHICVEYLQHDFNMYRVIILLIYLNIIVYYIQSGFFL